MQKMKQMVHSKDVYSEMDKIFDGDTNQSFTKIQNEIMQDDKNKTAKAQVAAPVQNKTSSAVQLTKPDPSHFVYHPRQASVLSTMAAPVAELATQPVFRRARHVGWSREMPQALQQQMHQEQEDQYLSAESQHSSSQDAYPGLAMSYQKVDNRDGYMK